MNYPGYILKKGYTDKVANKAIQLRLAELGCGTKMRRYVLFTFLILTRLLVWGQCDNTLKPSDNSKVAYKIRGNRCEGAYIAKVGAPSLDLIGATIGIFSYRLVSTETIKIKNTTNRDIFIRASALPLNSYYRMDASLAKEATLEWEVNEVLLDLKIPSNALGVYGWIGTEAEKIFVPVKPISSSYDTTNNNIYLLIRPSNKVLSVTYRYSKNGEALGDYEKIDGVFNANQSIQVILPESMEGNYTIEVAALLESKSGWVKSQYKISIP